MRAMAVSTPSMYSKPSVTASRTARTAAPGRHAAPAPGVRRQVCVVAQNSDRNMWSAVVAARKAAAALGQPAADPAAARRAAYQTLLKVGAISGCAAVGGLRVGGSLAVLLLPVPQLWNGYDKYADATAARHLELNRRHKQVRRPSLNAICSSTSFPYVRSAACISAVLRPWIASERSCCPAAAGSPTRLPHSPPRRPLPSRLCSAQQQCRSVSTPRSSWR